MNRSKISLFLLISLIGFHLMGLPVLTNILIGLSLLNSVLDRKIIIKLKTLLSNKRFWVLLIPFLAYSIGILYSEDTTVAYKEVEKKLSLLIFPVLIGLIDIKEKHIALVLKISVLLICFIPVIGFINKISIYLNTGDSGWFYNDNLVSLFKKQAVYYSLYINTAFLFIIYLSEKKLLSHSHERSALLFILPILVISQYLLASRMSIAITLLIILSYFIWLVSQKLNKKQGIVISMGGVVFLAILTFSSTKVINRFKSATNISYQFDNPNPINHYNGEQKKENWNGTNTRLAIWSCAIELVKQKPFFGYGLGDTQHKLYEKYQEKNFILALKRNYNTHNQYLDILLSSGAVGLILFIFFLSYLILTSIKEKNWLLLGFLVIFVFSCFTENILNRNQGIVFVSVCISLLYLISSRINQNVFLKKIKKRV